MIIHIVNILSKQLRFGFETIFCSFLVNSIIYNYINTVAGLCSLHRDISNYWSLMLDQIPGLESQQTATKATIKCGKISQKVRC